MLKSVVLYLTKDEDKKIIATLFASLKQHNISSITLKSQDGTVSLAESVLKDQKGSPKELLFISDDKQAILEANLLGIVCIGIQSPDSSGFLSGAYCVVTSLEDLNFEAIFEEYNHYHSLPSTVLTTKRLSLRELTVQEVPYLYQLYEDPDYVRFIPGLASIEEEMEKQEAYIKLVYNFYRFGLWGVFLKEENTLIGRCGLQCYEIGETTEVELAYLISSQYSRQGYGYEITSAILKYAKEHLNLDSLIARISPENEPSLYLAKRLGFHYEGKLPSSKESLYRIDL